MKIFDSSNPRVVAAAALAVLTLTQNVQGTADPLTVVSSNSTRIAVSIPTFGKLNVLNPSLTPNTITFNGVQAGDTVSIMGILFTAVSGAPSAQQFNITGGDTAAAASLATQIASFFRTGPGAWFRTEDQAVAFGLTVSEPTGLVSVSCTCGIEASFDGINATPINGLSTPAFNAISGTGLKSSMSLNVGGVAYVRANVSALTGAGAQVVVNLNGINSKSS